MNDHIAAISKIHKAGRKVPTMTQTTPLVPAEDTPDPDAVWTNFDPELAAEWLAKAAPKQRTIRPGKVAAFAADMRAGRWRKTGEACKRDVNGLTIDGRHRLTAVIESGATVRMLAIDGCAEEVMPVLDSGTVRQYRDVLQIEGHANAKDLASVTRRVFLWDHGVALAAKRTFRDDDGRERPPTNQELDIYLAEHPELEDYTALGLRLKPPRLAASISGTICTVLGRIDSEMMIEFMQSWADGVGLQFGSPILSLRERIARDAPLVSINARSGNDAWSEIKMGMAFIAWNAFREGRLLTKIQLPKGGLTNATYIFPK